MKVIKMERKVEMVTFEVLTNEVRTLAYVMEEAVWYFKSSRFQDKPLTLAAYLMGLVPMAEKKYEENPFAKIKITLHEDNFRLLLRALRTKLANSSSIVYIRMWSSLYYSIRNQVDKSIWKRCEKLRYGTK